jgi:hypothetical protein
MTPAEAYRAGLEAAAKERSLPAIDRAAARRLSETLEPSEAMVERAAEAAWDVYRSMKVPSSDWPTWGELLAQGHQGAGRVAEFRAIARAALKAAGRG